MSVKIEIDCESKSMWNVYIIFSKIPSILIIGKINPTLKFASIDKGLQAPNIYAIYGAVNSCAQRAMYIYFIKIFLLLIYFSK